MSTILPTSGKMPVYRFYITYPVGSITYEVFPLNFLESSLVDELEGDHVFYRRKYEGELIFGTNSIVIDEHGVQQNRKNDWLFLWDIEQNDECARLDFLITKTVEGVTTTYWEGYFSTADCKIDIDKCTMSVTPLTEDDYTDILNEADKQYNILQAGPAVSVHAYLLGVMDVTYTRNRWLMDVIEFLAEKIYDPTDTILAAATVNATFFTDTPNNYVTQSTQRLANLTIAQKSDIVRSTSSDPATTAMISWNELMEILYAMFQVKWNYEGAGVFNVEHISWSGFAKPSGIDLRTQLACVATNKYSYIKEKMPKFEKFSWMEVDDLDFRGSPIYYDSVCVDQNPETNIREYKIRVTTDIEYMNNNPELIVDDGFVIFATDGTNHVSVRMGCYNHSVKLNMDLSWANLHNAYFRHNRILKTGYLNNALVSFWTAIKTKLQPCSAIICEAFDSFTEITTELGEDYFGGAKATVNKATIKPTGVVNLELLYGPEDTEPTPIVDTKYVKVTQVGAMLNAALSQAADVNFTITVLEYTDCTMSVPAPQSWNIHIGDTVDTYDISGHVIAGLTSSDPNWPVYLIVDPDYVCS